MKDNTGDLQTILVADKHFIQRDRKENFRDILDSFLLVDDNGRDGIRARGIQDKTLQQYKINSFENIGTRMMGGIRLEGGRGIVFLFCF